MAKTSTANGSGPRGFSARGVGGSDSRAREVREDHGASATKKAAKSRAVMIRADL
jgi:hypothetical protein